MSEVFPLCHSSATGRTAVVENPRLLGAGCVPAATRLIPVGVRRMHDVGKSGWFILVPIYNLILACTDGENGDNEYGADPKAEEEEEEEEEA